MRILLKINNNLQIDEVNEIEVLNETEIKLYTPDDLMNIIVDISGGYDSGPLNASRDRLLNSLFNTALTRGYLDLSKYPAWYDESDDENDGLNGYCVACPDCNANVYVEAEQTESVTCPHCLYEIKIKEEQT